MTSHPDIKPQRFQIRWIERHTLQRAHGYLYKGAQLLNSLLMCVHLAWAVWAWVAWGHPTSRVLKPPAKWPFCASAHISLTSQIWLLAYRMQGHQIHCIIISGVCAACCDLFQAEWTPSGIAILVL
jgi:hypothetical protein